MLRSTPLLRALNPLATGTKILWVTHSPELIAAEACDAVRPTAATLARITAGEWDFCWNLDKDPEACAIAAATKATQYRGYTLRNGVPFPVDEAAWHKFATGIDDPYEAPSTPDIILKTVSTTAEENARLILDHVAKAEWLRADTDDLRA